MRTIRFLLPVILIAVCGCGTVKYRILMGGLDDVPSAATIRKYRLFPCEENDDGSFTRLKDEDNDLVKEAVANYPDVFSPTGEVVRVMLFDVNGFKDSMGKNVSKRSEDFEGLRGVWNILSAITLVSLPMFSEDEHAHRIVLQLQDKEWEKLGVNKRKYDFTARINSTFSLIPFVGWLFPYFPPSDTPFYRTGWDGPLESDPRNRKVLWDAAVARAAVELRQMDSEINFRLRDRQRRRKMAADAKPKTTPSQSSGISLEDLPF